MGACQNSESNENVHYRFNYLDMNSNYIYYAYNDSYGSKEVVTCVRNIYICTLSKVIEGQSLYQAT